MRVLHVSHSSTLNCSLHGFCLPSSPDLLKTFKRTTNNSNHNAVFLLPHVVLSILCLLYCIKKTCSSTSQLQHSRAGLQSLQSGFHSCWALQNSHSLSYRKKFSPVAIKLTNEAAERNFFLQFGIWLYNLGASSSISNVHWFRNLFEW